VEAGRERDIGGASRGQVQVGLSRDGKVAATVGGDGTVHLWFRATGRLLRASREARSAGPIAVSPDGALVAFIRDTHTRILVYRTATGELLQHFRGSSSWLAFSPDCKYLASGDNGEVVVHDVPSGLLRLRLCLPRYVRQTTGAFSPDGKTLVTGGEDGILRVWSTSGNRFRDVVAHGGLPVRSVSFSGDGKLLATAGANGFLCLWDTRTYRRLCRFSREDDQSSFVVLSPDSKTLISDCDRGGFYLWDVATEKVRGRFSGHREGIISAAIARDGKTLLTGSEDGTALVWDLTARRAAPVSPPAPRHDRHGEPLPPGTTARLGALRCRFGSEVQDAAFSPDGKTLAIVTERHWKTSLLLLDTATGKQLRRHDRFGRSMGLVRFSPNSKVLATAAEKDVFLWDRATGEKLDHFLGDHDQVIDLTFSPDSKVLAVSGSGRREGTPTILLWDVVGGRPLRWLSGHARAADCLAFSRDGKTLASASGTDVRFWEATTGMVLDEFKVDGPVRGFADDLKSLFLVTSRKVEEKQEVQLSLYDVKRRKTIRQIRAKEDSCLLAPDGKTVAVGGPSSGSLWDINTGKQLCRFQRPSENVVPLCFSPDGKVLLCRGGWRSWDSPLRWFDTSTGREALPAGRHGDALCCLAFTPDGKQLVSGSADRTVRLWEVRSGRGLGLYDGHQHEVTAVAVTPDGKLIASGDASGAVHLHERATGKRRHLFLAPPPQRFMSFRVTSLLFASGGKTLLAAGHDGSLRLWDVASGQRVRDLGGFNWSGGGLALSPDGRTLAFAGDDYGPDSRAALIRFWDLDTGKETRTLTGAQDDEFRRVAFSPDGKLLATSRSRTQDIIVGNGLNLDHQVVIFEVASRQEVLRIEMDARVEAMVFSRDGATLLTGGGGPRVGNDRTVRVWDIATGREVARLSGHLSWVLSLALSPDGRTLASGSADSTALLWETTWPRRSPPRLAARLTALEQRYLWAALADRQAAGAYRAVARLLLSPDQAVALLRQHLGPAAPGSSTQGIATLIANLDSDDFQVREKGRLGLEKLGEDAEPALRNALSKRPSLEPRRRIERLLARLEGDRSSPKRLRTLRAVSVLERLGTHEARELLGRLAAGAPDALLTRQAKEALSRLDLAQATRP
jgi:WD40 repeat protein